MANCTNCSAPLPVDTIVCAYCGSRNDVDLKGVHYFTTHEAATPRPCPRCRIPLTTIDLKLNGKFLIERCDQCLGLFFDPGELEALLDASVSNVYTINRTELNRIGVCRNREYGVSYIKCPVCATVMNRVNFGAKSGVIVDCCKDHGTWLDGGELRHLFEWMKAGGQLLEQQRQEERRKEEEAQEKDKRAELGIATNREWAAGQDGTEYGSMRYSDLDLFDVLAKVARFILK